VIEVVPRCKQVARPKKSCSACGAGIAPLIFNKRHRMACDILEINLIRERAGVYPVRRERG
jgi:hypothetical protein